MAIRQPVMVDCPVDGCEYDGLAPSVLAHYSGKQDDAHGSYAEGEYLIRRQIEETDR